MSGRWAIERFEIYLRNDESALRYVGERFGKKRGLLQHRIAPRTQKLVRFGEENLIGSEEERAMPVGGIR